jgi:hypothetical protein
MRYPASEKLAIIRIVEQSHLPVTRTLDKLGIPKTTFYRWYDRYLVLGEAGLKTAHRTRAGSGTVFLTMCGSGLSIWPSMSPSCRHGQRRSGR